MSTLLILVVVGLSIVAVTLAVVAEPDKPATEQQRNLRGGRPRTLPVTTPTPAAATGSTAGATAEAAAVEPPAPAAAAGREQAPARTRRGDPYRPPQWWQRARSIVLLVILTALVGATIAAIVGAVLALLGLGVREAVT